MRELLTLKKDKITGKLVDSVGVYSYEVTETIYDPDGKALSPASYNTDNNYMTVILSSPGTYTGKIAVTGDLNMSKEFKIEAISPNFTITYDANGGENEPAAQLMRKDQTGHISEKQPIKKYNIVYDANEGECAIANQEIAAEFDKWTTEKNGEGRGFSAGEAYTGNADITLYAQWKNPVVGNLPTAHRNGYNFTGWYTSKIGGNQITRDTVVTSSATYYAHFEELPRYTINYQVNGGVGRPAAQTKIQGDVLTLTDQIPKKSYTITLDVKDGVSEIDQWRLDYTFDGWNTQIDGKGIFYSAGESYYGDQDMTLYAQWKEVPVGVQVENTIPNRRGYTFTGWYYVRGNQEIKVASTTVLKADTIVYAGWEEQYVHSYTSTVIKSATCTETGARAFICSCGERYEETIPATGHGTLEVRHQKEATETEKGYTGDICCSVCGEVIQRGTEIAAKHIHRYIAEVTKTATCLEKGIRTYTCSCGDSYTEEIAISPSNHVSEKEIRNRVDATETLEGYTGDTYCKCGVMLEKGETIPKLKPAHTHSYTSTAIKSATCTETGVRAFICACGERYEETIPAKGHGTLEVRHQKEATETEKGYTGDVCCAVCNEVVQKGTEIPATHIHKYVSEVTKEATCLEKGIKTYTCSCGDSYTEEVAISKTHHVEDRETRGQVEATESAEGYTGDSYCKCGTLIEKGHVVPKLQPAHTHSYTSTVTKSATCTEAGTKIYVCVCGDRYEETIPAKGHAAFEIRNQKSATDTEKGYTGDICCVVCHAVIQKGTEIPATHIHKYVSEETKKATCVEKGLRTYTCSCGDSYTEEVAIARAHHVEDREIRGQVEATENAEGYTGDVYCKCGTLMEKGEAIPKLQPAHTHSYTSTVTKRATCTEVGTKVFACDCGDRYEEAIPAAGHTVVKDAAAAATCEKNGLSEGSHCSSCGAVITKQKVIEKTGHQYTNEWRAVDGEVHSRSCSKCQTVEKQAHTWNAGETIVEATTSSEGAKTYTCTGCGWTRTEKLPKLPAQQTSQTEPETPGNRPTPSANTVDAAKLERQIVSVNSDADPRESSFYLLQAKGTAKSKTSIKLAWKAVPSASQYIVYGNKCGRGNKYKKLAAVSGTSYTQKKLKKGTYYKYLVVAVSGNQAVAVSKTIHVATKGGKSGNARKVNVAKTAMKVAIGKKTKLKASVVAETSAAKIKKHRALSFESTNSAVATVSKKGVIKGVSKGICYVYVYAQNGVAKRIRVTVR